MVNIRVVEALQHVAGKLLQLVHWQIQGLHQLFKLYLVDVLADYLMVAGIANDVNAREISHGRENGVRTVEQGHLALVVWLLAFGDEHMQAGLLCGEFGTQVFDAHVGWLLDDPEVEDLCLYDEVVGIGNLLLDIGNLLAGESGNDAVNECGANVVVLLKPLLESFIVSTEVILPELDVLLDALLQVMAVQEDQLARHDDKSL